MFSLVVASGFSAPAFQRHVGPLSRNASSCEINRKPKRRQVKDCLVLSRE